MAMCPFSDPAKPKVCTSICALHAEGKCVFYIIADRLVKIESRLRQK